MRSPSLALAAACLLAGGGAAGPVTAIASSPVPTFAGCAGVAPQIKPRSILVACGDGNFYLDRLTSKRWTRRDAVGAGTGHQNDCRPNCAAGRFHAYQLAIRLTRPETCRLGRRRFTRLTYSFTAGKPVGVKRTQTLEAPFYIHNGCP